MIDVETVRSPGWWLVRASNELNQRFPRINGLVKRLEGNGPLPQSGVGMEKEYRKFQRRARAAWEDRIVEACLERMKLEGIRTAQDSDSDGDEIANAALSQARFFVEIYHALWMMLGASVGYTITGRVITPSGRTRTVVTSEDPRNTITFHDPATDEVEVGVKIFTDYETKKHYAHLYGYDEDGRVRRWVASSEGISRRREGRPPRITNSWSWEREEGGVEGTVIDGIDLVPVTRFLNHKGVADYEPHIDVLDRITHGTLQRLLLVALQAFQQRTIIGAPDEDEDGNKIDYDGILPSGPNAVWRFPEGVSVEQFDANEITGVLAASKDDRKELCALTATPLPVLMPDATNQSAEGAAFSKEQLLFRTDKRCEVATEPVVATASLVLQYEGLHDRADMAGISLMWADTARRSLTEMADADSKAQNTLPLVERLTKIYGYSPQRAAEVALLKRQEMEEQARVAMFGPIPALPTPAPADAS